MTQAVSHSFSHWGLFDHSDSEGTYEVARRAPVRLTVGVVLTEAGEVLINRSCTTKPEACCVAIVIGRSAPGLSRPQAERMQRAWDTAMAVANGSAENIQLQPMPHHWRFSRTDYLTIEEWQATRMSGRSASAINSEKRV